MLETVYSRFNVRIDRMAMALWHECRIYTCSVSIDRYSYTVIIWHRFSKQTRIAVYLCIVCAHSNQLRCEIFQKVSIESIASCFDGCQTLSCWDNSRHRLQHIDVRSTLSTIECLATFKTYATYNTNKCFHLSIYKSGFNIHL